MRDIPIEEGVFVCVDDGDSELIERGKWWLLRRRHSKAIVAVVGKPLGYTRKRPIALHRYLTGDQAGKLVDHINGDTLDNRRANLRVCSHSENMKNRRLNVNKTTSRFKGVWFDVSSGRWRAGIEADGKRKSLGSFSDEIVAARSYDRAAAALHGEFARTNVMLGLLPAS